MNHTSQRIVSLCLSVLTTAAAIGQETGTDETVVLEEFNVTGSNLAVELDEGSLPISTIDMADAEALGATTFADLVDAIPASQNIGFNDTATGPNDARGDVASINLRNLGAGRSLVLLNGRRMSAYGVTPGTPPVQFVNLNSIPFAAISRIDILRDGASAIYGSDAIGGVLNTQLRTSYTGFEAGIRQVFGDPDPDEFTIDLSGGLELNDGRTRVAVFASYYDRSGLLARDRDYAAFADKRPLVNEEFAQNDNFDRRSSSAPQGRFTAVDEDGDAVAVAGVTGTTGSARGRFYIDPETNELRAGTGPSAFYDFQGDGQLIPTVERYSLYSTFQHDLTTETTFFGEFSYYTSESDGQTATTPISSGTDGVVAPASNYYNPAGTRFFGPGTANPAGTPRDVLIRNHRPVEIGARTYETEIDSIRLLAGLRGRAFEDWRWETAVMHMTGKTYQENNNYMAQSLLEQQLALSTPDAFNPFAGPDANAPEQYEPFVIDIWDEGRGTVTSLDGKLSGSWFDLPGGPVSTAFGGEYRRESMKQRNDAFGLADDVIAQSEQIDIDASRDVYAAFAEVLFPLVGEDNRRQFLESAEVRLAARYENYEEFDALKPAVSLAVSPFDFLTLRASYNEGFRAPSVVELFQPQRDRRNNGLIDVARDGQEDAEGTVSKRVVTGGNPDLDAEESESFNVGFVAEIVPVPGLAFSMDVYQIKSLDRIDNPDAQDELDLDARLWEESGGSNPLVIREEQTPEDVALGIPGRLIEIRGTYFNLAEQRVSGVDAGLACNLPETSFGRFVVKGEVSYTTKLESIDREGNVSRLLRQAGNPRAKALVTLGWRKLGWSASASGRFLSDYENSSAYDNPVDGSPLVLEDQWLFNLSAGHAFSSGPLDGTSLRVGVNNITDEDPPLFLSASDGYDSSYYNAKGRQWYVQLNRKF
ncbi:MAG: TonB-dependent receptor domain-containing protein [Opitutaceae bacterium]